MKPIIKRRQLLEMNLAGFIKRRIEANLKNWLLTAPYANPAMIETFRNRDRCPRPELVPWYGEFLGKYLTSAALGWTITKNKELYEMINSVVDELAAVQNHEGYLGPHPYNERLTGERHRAVRLFHETGEKSLWDIWGHYHCMFGLLLWYKATGNKKAFEVCTKAADYICNIFLSGGKDIIEAGAMEMNMAVIHIYCLLYQMTKDSSYFEMIRYIEKKWEHPGAGDYVRSALQGNDFFQMPKPRWESLHNIQAIAELYLITNKQKYLEAFKHLWWSMLEYDRHNTGGFGSDEQAIGNPYYDQRSIETCCTVAWIALTIDMLRCTGESYAADELELSTFNAILGAQHPSGHWWTYNTPMNGQRRASHHDLYPQSLAGGPELNCCSVYGPRGLGMLIEWALMESKGGLVLNYYGPGTIKSTLGSGQRITVDQATDYPVSGDIRIRIGLERPETFTLRLRIPSWSIDSHVIVNGKSLGKPTAGKYFDLRKDWKDGDTIELSLDMSLHFWPGEREMEGKASIYRGPVLLTYDQRYNEMDPEKVPTVNPKKLDYQMVSWDKWPNPWLLLRLKGKDGRDLYLCDFASAGAVGTYYASWLPVEGLRPMAFDKKNPLRSLRI